MTRTDGIDVDDLRDALAAVEGKRPALRLVAAIAHERGASQREIADWFGVGRKTVYNWLRRFEEPPDDLVEAATDRPRPGRPSKLSPDARRDLAGVLAAPPEAAGHDASEWTPAVLEEHVRDAYGVEYSRASCRRLLAEYGPS